MNQTEGLINAFSINHNNNPPILYGTHVINPMVGKLFNFVASEHNVLVMHNVDPDADQFELEKEALTKNNQLVGVVKYYGLSLGERQVLEEKDGEHHKIRYNPLEIVVMDRSHYFRKYSNVIFYLGRTARGPMYTGKIASVPSSHSKNEYNNWIKEENKIRVKNMALLYKIFRLAKLQFLGALDLFIGTESNFVTHGDVSCDKVCSILYCNNGCLPFVSDTNQINYIEGNPISKVASTKSPF